MINAFKKDGPGVFRPPVFLVPACLGMILFTYLTPPLVPKDLVARIPWLGGLAGDLPFYGLRFLLSFLLLGVLPFFTALLMGETIKNLGLARPRPFLSKKIFLFIILFAVPFGFIGAYLPGLYSYYPYSRTLLSIIAGRSFGLFFLHVFLYLALYYLPWELFFRGFLIFPLISLFDSGQVDRDGRQVANLSIIISFQAVLSTLLHFGHPLSETLSALPFGLFLGYLALKTGSILPGLLIHSVFGIALDFFIVIRQIGVLP